MATQSDLHITLIARNYATPKIDKLLRPWWHEFVALAAIVSFVGLIILGSPAL